MTTCLIIIGVIGSIMVVDDLGLWEQIGRCRKSEKASK